MKRLLSIGLIAGALALLPIVGHDSAFAAGHRGPHTPTPHHAPVKRSHHVAPVHGKRFPPLK